MWNSALRTILIILWCQLSLQATQPYHPTIVDPLTQSWRWKQFPELEGKGIRNIFEGRDKTIWITSNEGIFEYNGYEWKLHNQANGLDDSPIELIHVTRNGTVYAASSFGIYRLQGDRWINEFEIPQNTPFYFKQLVELSNGLIAAPSNRGLLLLGETAKIYTSEARIAAYHSRFPDSVEWVPLPNELTPEEDFIDISDILLDRQGLVWVAITLPKEEGRLLSFNASELAKNYIDEYTIYSSNAEIQLGESQHFLEATDGTLWIVNSTYRIGISQLKDGKWSYLKLSDQFTGDEYMTDIVESDDGTIWIGSLGKMYAYKDKQWALYTAPNFPIPANRLILQKSKGDFLWVAGYKSKVFFLDFSFDTWISYDHLNFQFQDLSGYYWFLDVEGKVVCQKGDQWLAYDVDDGLIDAPIRIVQTQSGQIWAAGSHGGDAAMAVLKDGRWERFVHPELSWGIDYRSVFEDSSGALWFGGAVDAESLKGQRGGVIKLVDPMAATKEWIHYKGSERGLQQSNVYGIGQSDDGRVWIGGGKLYGFNGDEWQTHTDTRLQQVVNVVCSKSDLLVVGSRYYGVFLFDGKQWRNYDTSKGLSGNTVLSLDILGPDCIYVATENDICRFDGQGWTPHVFPEEMNMEFEGGMLLHDNKGSVWINKSSRSWKRRAFSYNKTRDDEKKCFVAHRYLPDNVPPRTAITVYSKEVSPEGNVLIKWDGKDYFAQSAQKDLMYSFKLDDGEWSPYTTEKHYTFMSLRNGDYRLKVRARDLDMNVDPTPAEIEFTVLPPVWKQMWFILLMLAFLTVLGIFEYRIITKKRKLEILNDSLHQVNEKLKHRGQKIASQNQEILAQQEQIIEQASILAEANKNLEERNYEIRKQKDKLEEMVVRVEELSKAKLGFFTNISHELRTPLTLISGPIGQLMRYGDAMPDATRHDLYRIIERNSNRLLRLINQLLEMRRIEKSNLDLNYLSVSLPGFLGEIVSMFDNLAVEKDIYLEFAHQCDQEVFTIDPDKLEKIMVNLLSNAFKHTPGGGSIYVQLAQRAAAEAGLSPLHDTYLEITVEDTGCGIRQEDLEHIYERFYAPDPQNIPENSSGIGLSYIRELVNLLQGDIQVESEVGTGTAFRVYLPAHPAVETNMDLRTPSPLQIARKEVDSLMLSFTIENEIKEVLSEGDHQKRKILIVEDQQDMQLFLRSILEDKFDLITADNGREGLAKASTHTVDLIISDIMMPEMDGLSFCKALRSNMATSHIPVVLLTARVMEKDQIEGFECGADAYLTKPFNPDMLLVRIENLLLQREQLKTSFTRDFMLQPQKIKLASPDEELLQKIVAIMEEHLEDTNFNVNQMCKMVHLSHMHFIRKVKQLTGKKPIDLLKSFRLKRAKDLLLQNNISISEIAYKVGYDLPNSFSRAFKKEFGMSPKEFVSREVEVEEAS
ncbi:MAG: response regulator [Saprospiraceae bacterium]|nr:response regulator [Lewinella sp.]